MARYIATFSDTINDIEINGFTTMTDKEVERLEELASSITWDFTYNIANEELDYSSGDDLLSRIDFVLITTEEYKMIKKIFNGNFGTFITEDDLIKIIGDEEDEDDENLDDEFEEDDEY